MDTRQLAAFCAVVEKRNSQAAESLGVTQPAVSLQVRALEERLDDGFSTAQVAASSRRKRVLRSIERLSGCSRSSDS